MADAAINVIVVSERDKGLLPAVSKLLPEAFVSYRHICDDSGAKKIDFNILSRKAI